MSPFCLAAQSLGRPRARSWPAASVCATRGPSDGEALFHPPHERLFHCEIAGGRHHDGADDHHGQEGPETAVGMFGGQAEPA